VQLADLQFQPTPPRGGRPRRRWWTAGTASFNPRPRVGGDVSPLGAAESMRGFNPRPRVGGDDVLTGDLCKIHVSTHAPAWGATTP